VPTLIASPTRVEAAGNLPKLIDEYVGRLNTKEERLSVAHMRSPAGWIEPGQMPEFLEYTVVLKGRLVVTYKQGTSKEESFEVRAGQAVVSHPGEWIRYSTPYEATEYVAICLPAFSPATVHRDE
jgi:mannose-6-phosphate isomerase-like protein (cupin superfamily)